MSDSIPLDQFGRSAHSLRISVTDRCNIRCRYCMPEEEYVWLPRQSILTYEEINRLLGVFARLGVSRVRLTGGEPLLRHDLSRLVQLLSDGGALQDIALTTNGILLSRYAEELKAAGLSRVTVSLDTLKKDRFVEFTRSARHDQVLEGIRIAREIGFRRTKLNTVVIRGVNDDEILDLIRFGRDNGVEVRLIEYMDVGGATRWSLDQVVSRGEILDIVGDHFGGVEPVAPIDGRDERAPAERYRLPDGTTFGIIASTTEPFCSQCDRSRLTADGQWLLCLYAHAGLDLRGPIRSGATDEELTSVLVQAWRNREDKGAEDRLASPDRGVLYPVERLRANPHREMHTRGG